MSSRTTRLPLQTERLVLRELVQSDWEAILRASGPEEVRYMHEKPYAEEDAKSWIEREIKNQDADPRMRFCLAVVVRDEDQVIGYCDLTLRQPLESRMAYSGFRYDHEYWGHGYGTEALDTVFAFGFSQFDLRRISCICDPPNISSWRVMEKSGMRREGHGVQDRWVFGEWIDTYYYAVLKDEWKRRTLTT